MNGGALSLCGMNGGALSVALQIWSLSADNGIILPLVLDLHAWMRLRRLSRQILQKVELHVCSSGARRQIRITHNVYQATTGHRLLKRRTKTPN